MPITLDPIRVTADFLDLPSGPGWSLGTIHTQPPGARTVAQIIAMAKKYVQSDQYTTHALRTLAIQNDVNSFLKCSREFAKISNVYNSRISAGQNPVYLLDVIEVVGYSEINDDEYPWLPPFAEHLLPVVTLLYYALGPRDPGANERHAQMIPISILGLKTAIEDIYPVKAGLNAHVFAPGTTTDFEERYMRNTANDSFRAQNSVGHISLKVAGRMTVNSEGWYEFRGELSSGASDIYDGGGPIPERSDADNFKTAILTKLAEWGLGYPYQLHITGKIPLYFSGHINEH